MKALVIADRNPTINLVETVKNENINLLISLGDFAREELLQLSLINSIPKIGVYGNHCSGTYMPEIGMWDMHCKIWRYNGFSFGGFGGCVRYKSSPYAVMFTQEEATNLTASFPYVDTFITHCPPRGVNDEEELAHQGWDWLRDYVLKRKPKILLHGHTYPNESNLVRQLGNTKIEYVHGWKIINI